VLHQAASFGTVPIFPRIGDFVDLCEDEGLRGHHYAPGDAAQMAEAMAAALSDLGAAQAMANGNRAASMGMPFSEVVAFHVDRIAGFAHSARVAGGAQPAAGSS
jgi:glycosyltransferase involved in cell wall biosynthesis